MDIPLLTINRHHTPCRRSMLRAAVGHSAKVTRQSWFAILLPMDVERIIDEIQQLEEMFEAADIRPLTETDISAANRRHDEALAHSPWFKLWQHYGICCRPETPGIQLPE